MDNKNKCTPEEAKKAYFTGHYPYMVQAFAIASMKVPAWRLASDGTPVQMFDVLRFAQKWTMSIREKKETAVSSTSAWKEP